MAENSKGREGSGRSNNEGKKTSNRGFASMDPEQQREIARKGGAAVSEDREHMAEIGKKGGEASSNGRGGKGGSR